MWLEGCEEGRVEVEEEGGRSRRLRLGATGGTARVERGLGGAEGPCSMPLRTSPDSGCVGESEGSAWLLAAWLGKVSSFL